MRAGSDHFFGGGGKEEEEEAPKHIVVGAVVIKTVILIQTRRFREHSHPAVIRKLIPGPLLRHALVVAAVACESDGCLALG